LTRKKEKKTVIAFMMGIAALYSSWVAVEGISQKSNIPLPILLIIILIVYLIWKD